ncbi:TGF-beta-activated kinase 1 and MAP3K7-binding protein 2 isoform X2 [Anthonomus grandis grandis]|uniref:TGF-beta-activated kinase 1 and MAP3K7-binding protein 2 isoform X2 n=1 Tax=Anthonomus grandis grandis TaxID=2921223 RepID=UPI0021658582|nr:TGF-beta-activated kinase 1 and MAP3K7-binding protein 2 isoform X2 [Anthonomus grandis grandis]
MFAGKANQRSSNVRVMQIFHELKAQFPIIPDHIITSCIASYVISEESSLSSRNLHDLVLAAVAKDQNCPMGRPSLQLEAPPSIPITPVSETAVLTESKNHRLEPPTRIDAMNESALVNSTNLKSDNNNTSNLQPKRPNSLNLRPDERRLQLSEKCRDVFKLLNSQVTSEKPPRSPLSAKRFAAKQVPKNESPKKETVSTPTQTTDTLVNNITSPASLNLSLNVNCQMGLVQSPTKPRCTARVDVTPTQPWLSPVSSSSSGNSPRSFTSVNLTLRPPTSTPQDPIDITSQNSSLTYSTSSFDKEKGLQSRLQITVGPGNSGSVSSVRARPRSFHLGDSGAVESEMVSEKKASSMGDLAVVKSEVSTPVLLKQQARIENMRIELRTGNTRLVVLRQEVEELERKRLQKIATRKTEEEIEKQLRMEIKHLNSQCKLLEGPGEFYNNIYTGPPLWPEHRPHRVAPAPPPAASHQLPSMMRRSGIPERGVPFRRPWNCSKCTFLNHPALDKCEQCEMPQIFHVSASPGDNIHIHVTPRLSRRIAHSWVL